MANYSPDNDAKQLVRPSLNLWFLWIAANAIGSVLGAIVGIMLEAIVSFVLTFTIGTGSWLSEPPTNPEPVWETIIIFLLITLLAGMPFGGLIGVMQWLVLRKYIPNSRLWILTSAFAMVVGYAWFELPPEFFSDRSLPDLFLLWFPFGCVSGILQWLILRKQVYYSGLWIAVNIIAGGIADLPMLDFGYGFIINWAIAGIFTGAALFLLLQMPKSDVNA
jgi:hypothetical protein